MVIVTSDHGEKFLEHDTVGHGGVLHETLLRIPDLVRRIEDRFPAKGGAPEPPPLPDIELMWEKRRETARSRGWLGYALAAGAGGLAAWIAIAQGWIG